MMDCCDKKVPARKKERSEEEVRGEVRRAIEAYAPYGAFIPCITYGLPESIYPGVFECIQDEVDKYNKEHM